MKRKLGPLPVWAWVLIAGGGLGAFVLWKKQKEREGPSTEGEIPIATGQVIQPEPTSSGGGSVGSLEASTAKSSAEAEVLRQEMQFQSQEYEHQLSLLQGMGGQAGLGQALEAIQQIRGLESALGIVPPSQTQTTPAATANPALAGPLKQNTLPGSPRKGKQYTEGTYTSRATGQSWTAHYYSTPVPGGKGPGGNIVLVGGPSAAPLQHGHAGPHAPAAPHTANPFPNQGPHGRYRTITYRGKHVHEYQHSFRGGVGPRHNMVVV